MPESLGRFDPDRQALIITVHAGDPEFGIWCDTCLLPSAIRIPVLNERDVLLWTQTVCTDCGEGLPS